MASNTSSEYKLKGDDLKKKIDEQKRQLAELAEKRKETEKKYNEETNNNNKKNLKKLLKFEFEERKKLQEEYFKLRLSQVEEITDIEEKAAAARELQQEAFKADAKGGFGLED